MQRRSFLALAAIAPVLAACSNREAAQNPGGSTGSGGSSSSGDSGASRTIDHIYGSTTITGMPSRVATVGWSDQDAVVALGVKPIGATAITWGGNSNQSTDWFDAAVAELPGPDVTRYSDADGIPVDQIAALGPDLILGVGSGMSQEEYDRLSRIAPTVPFLETAWGTPWDQQTTIIGEALGLRDEAVDLVARIDDQIDDAVLSHAAIQGRSVAWAWITPTDLSTITLYATSDMRPTMLRRFGMVDSPTVVELSQGQFTANLSSERAAEINADVFIWYGSMISPDQLRADPLLSQIPALVANHYYAPTDDQQTLSMTYPTPLSIPVALEHVLPGIAQAAAGVA